MGGWNILYICKGKYFGINTPGMLSLLNRIRYLKFFQFFKKIAIKGIDIFHDREI